MSRHGALIDTSWENDWKWGDPSKTTLKELFWIKKYCFNKNRTAIKVCHISGLSTEMWNDKLIVIPQVNNHALTKAYFFSTIPTSKPSLNFIPLVDSLNKNVLNTFRDPYLASGIFQLWPFAYNACHFTCLCVKCLCDLTHISVNDQIKQTGFQSKLCYLLSMWYWTDSFSSSVR